MLVLLSGVGHGICVAEDAEKEFKKSENFTAKATDEGAIHFRLLTAHDKSWNFWSDPNNPSKVMVTVSNTVTKHDVTYTIAQYSGESENSNFKLKVFHGAFIVTNCKNTLLYGVPNAGYEFSDNTGNDKSDEHFLEFDWYPTQDMIENCIITVSMEINRRGNTGWEWVPIFGKDITGTTTFSNIKIDLAGRMPTVTMPAPEFLSDKKQAVDGKVLSVSYSASKEPLTCWSQIATGGNEISSPYSQRSFCISASDVQQKESFTLKVLRNSKLDRSEYRFFVVKSNSITIPAYHRIYNFGIDRRESASRLTWEMHSVNETDYQDNDAFVIQYSSSPNFSSDVKEVALEYQLSKGICSEGNGFTSELTDGSRKFYCDLLGNESNDASGITYYRIQRRSTVSLGWSHSLVLFASTSKFMSELCVSVSTNSTEARLNLLDKGFTILDYNLNHGVKGYYVYVGYKQSDDPLNAISRIAIKKGSDWASDKGATFTEGKYTMKAVPCIGIDNGNLNAGVAGADALYLYYSRDNTNGLGNSVITRLMYTGNTDKAALPTGFRFVGSSIDDNPDAVDLNSGCPGGTEKITMMCQLHKHVSELYGKELGNDMYIGHDCCGLYFNDAFHDGVLEIADSDELYAFAGLVNDLGMTSLKAKLIADINLNEKVTVMDGDDILTSRLNPDESRVKTFRNWTPIGTFKHKFNGQFDGNGHVISGLYCVEGSDKGLFGRVSDPAVISNVTLKDSYIKTDQMGDGGICGDTKASGQDGDLILIKNCIFEGVLEGNEDAGAILGYHEEGDIEIRNCASRGVIYAEGNNSQVGGIVGTLGAYTTDAVIKNCYSYVDFVKKDNSKAILGGIVGRSETSKALVDNCYCLYNTISTGPATVRHSEILSKQDFFIGKAAYLLNYDETPLWAQRLNEDIYPVFFDAEDHTHEFATVYEVEGYRCIDRNVKESTGRYSNHDDEAAVLVHWAIHHPANQATCTQKGCLEYWECQHCAKLFSNKECTTNISYAPTIEPLHHDIDVYTQTCVNCGKSRIEIDEEEDATAIRTVETESGKAQMFDILGRPVTESHRGITIIKGADGKVRKVLKK